MPYAFPHNTQPIRYTMQLRQRITLVGTGALLASCGVIQTSSIEAMPSNERLAFLRSKSNEELCRGYNNIFLEPNSEVQIAALLRERGITRCDALSKIRLVPTAGVDASKATEQRTPATSFGSNADIHALIEKMRAESISKGPLELQTEFMERRARLVAAYKTPLAFKVSLDIDNKNNSRDRLVHYDPESGEMRIAMPRTSSSGVLLNIAGKEEARLLHNSFVATQVIENQLGTHTASNRFGASIMVVRSEQVSHGINILNSASRDLSKETRQTFSKAIAREEAKKLLESGKLLLEVVVDTRYPKIDDHPFLIRYEDKIIPTFDRPVDLTITRYGVPVRLLAIELIDAGAKVVFRAVGTALDSNAITN